MDIQIEAPLLSEGGDKFLSTRSEIVVRGQDHAVRWHLLYAFSTPTTTWPANDLRAQMPSSNLQLRFTFYLLPPPSPPQPSTVLAGRLTRTKLFLVSMTRDGGGRRGKKGKEERGERCESGRREIRMMCPLPKKKLIYP